MTVMQTIEQVIRVSGDMDGFARAAEALRVVLDDWQLAERPRYRVETVFEEIVTNVIKYGYTDDRHRVIEVFLTRKADEVEVAVEDNGDPFDPLARPDPERPISIEDAPIGGLGIMLVRKMAGAINYERSADRNRLTVTIPMAPAGG
jgi:anti-sigma regulatory factor (Ser/Thr protein kinase)